MAARTVAEETERMIIATKQLFYAMEVHKLLHFENADVRLDWLGLVPIFACIGFGILGLYQWIKRRRLLKVDFNIRVLGIYYILVIFEYLIFEMTS